MSPRRALTSTRSNAPNVPAPSTCTCATLSMNQSVSVLTSASMAAPFGVNSSSEVITPNRSYVKTRAHRHLVHRPRARRERRRGAARPRADDASGADLLVRSGEPVLRRAEAAPAAPPPPVPAGAGAGAWADSVDTYGKGAHGTPANVT